MRTPATVEDGAAWTSGYGLGFQVWRDSGRSLCGHSGSMPGFVAQVVVDQATTTGALAMANSTAGVRVGGLSVEMVKMVDDYEPALPAEWRPSGEVSPELLALTGPWYWGPTPFVLRLLTGGWVDLRPASGIGRGSRFRPAGDNQWIGLDGYYAGETLRLHHHDDGSVSHLDLATFIFTRTPYDPKAPVPGGLDPRGWHPGA
jgi:hypothetical protein